MNTDRLLQVKMAISASRVTNKILEKHGRITPKLPLAVPHILAYGPGGCGKTSAVEEAAGLMGCSEYDNSYIKVSGETINCIEEFIITLQSKLSWQGYLCNQGRTDHTHCCKVNHHIIDPVNPRSPVKPQLVFFDEIHVLSKDLQEKLGLIILDFRYEILDKATVKTIFFPKFTFAGATTKPGDLLKPLRTRFGIKIAVQPYSDEEMIEIVRCMVQDRGWNVDEESIEIIAEMSQGIPREAGNHLTGLYGCWAYLLETRQISNRYAITREVTEVYSDTCKYYNSGLNADQVRVLKYLADLSKTKVVSAGVTRICNALAIDPARFSDEIEPRLVYKGFLTSGNRGREITEEGKFYVTSLQ